MGAVAVVAGLRPTMNATTASSAARAISATAAMRVNLSMEPSPETDRQLLPRSSWATATLRIGAFITQPYSVPVPGRKGWLE